MVDTHRNGVRIVASANEPTTGGCGRERVTSLEGETQVENIPMEMAPPAPQAEVEENVEID